MRLLSGARAWLSVASWWLRGCSSSPPRPQPKRTSGSKAGVYNLLPTPGSATTIGLSIDENASLQEASLRPGPDFGITLADVTIPTSVELQGVSIHVWGQPMDESHDPLRLCVTEGTTVVPDCPSDTEPASFLTLPTACGEALATTMRADSLQDPGAFVKETALTLDEEGQPAGLGGCEALHFSPTISARPQTTAADSPTGLSVDVHVPQSEGPEALATSHLKDTTVTLPAGVTLNPSAAEGRSACTLAQIDLATATSPSCPDSSKVATAKVRTPLVDHPLAGSVYLAAQQENPFGSLLALYLVVDDPITGVVVKLAGEVEPDPASGQLVTTFRENPQVPFEDFELEFFGGPRATLTTPSTCGTYTTTTRMAPWSGGPDATPSDSFKVSQGAGGGACASSEAQLPNSPSFEAGTQTPLAGAFSPFVLKLTRENGTQHFAALNVTLPPGLSARFAGRMECSDAQIAQAEARRNPGEGALEQAAPSCPAGSQLGTVTVGAGSGSPFYVQGHAYLAGPYKGAPFSIVAITPAVAGPFDLGTVVVRSALYVNEETAQGTVKTDPIPAILQGIPLQVRSIAITVDNGDFTLNPTSCEAKAVGGELISTTGAVAALSNRFQVGGCAGLGFKPKLGLKLKGSRKNMKRSGHPALTAVLTPKAGDANLKRTTVLLPHSMFIDQFHISNPCTRVQYAEGDGQGSKCPKASILGTVKAWTPLLDNPLEGKIYFRSNGGARELPDVVLNLNGQIHIEQVGFVDSRHERIRTRFTTLPDAPISRAVINFFGGKRGLLENSAELCAQKQKARVTLAGQNGRSQAGNTVIQTPSCKSKKGKGHKRHAHHAHRG